jgi:mRNA-degrading endonuclease YafQ of YafQ-DinJ toxin-antitoxin module
MLKYQNTEQFDKDFKKLLKKFRTLEIDFEKKKWTAYHNLLLQ